MEWHKTPATGLEAAIARFKRDLPGWWYRVCECQVSCDATCAPTGEVEGWRDLCARDERFNSGFDADLLQPSTLADALDAVREDALEALNAVSPAPAPSQGRPDRPG